MLFPKAKTGNYLNVHQQEKGGVDHASGGILGTDTEVALHTVRRSTPGSPEDARGRPRPRVKRAKERSGREHISLPTILRGHIFPPPVFQNLCTVLLLS